MNSRFHWENKRHFIDIIFKKLAKVYTQINVGGINNQLILKLLLSFK